ncbi:Dynein gamma chain, flagellar outer arm [Symbiodinium microadriaticum]|uniref:Dynein gamma chain, flagellar outer arm n=1 Tax=Symbiodinium microadriaticum TaxID=2951 RepID=A0A1Q9E9Z1_SYMMI|nr:Dynein gamma chain, flagellar outer arm [Symbiodinium microadriaticum]
MQVYRYMNRGLYERDKMLFKLLVTLKIMLVASQSFGNRGKGSEIFKEVKAGSSLDSKAERPNPFGKWLPDKVWLNVIALSRQPFGVDQIVFFREIPDFMQRRLEWIAGNEAAWRKWYDENEPEGVPIPDYDERINMDRLESHVLLPGEDRTTISCNQFIEVEFYVSNGKLVSKEGRKAMLDSRFTAPVTDGIADIYEEFCSLVSGSDPTFSIDELAKKKKKYPTDKEKNNAAFVTGGWVILQNSHLGIGYMCELEDVLLKTPEIDEAFRSDTAIVPGRERDLERETARDDQVALEWSSGKEQEGSELQKDEGRVKLFPYDSVATQLFEPFQARRRSAANWKNEDMQRLVKDELRDKDRQKSEDLGHGHGEPLTVSQLPTEDELVEATQSFHRWLSSNQSPFRSLLFILAGSGTYDAAHAAELLARASVTHHKLPSSDNMVKAMQARISKPAETSTPAPSSDVIGLFG